MQNLNVRRDIDGVSGIKFRLRRKNKSIFRIFYKDSRSDLCAVSENFIRVPRVAVFRAFYKVFAASDFGGNRTDFFADMPLYAVGNKIRLLPLSQTARVIVSVKRPL